MTTSLPPGVTLYKPRSKLLWHAARSRCVTASVAGALLGISPYKTLYRLWAEKTERIGRDDAENDAMRKGRLLEPAAIELAREDFPKWSILYKRDNAFYCNETLRIGATPDAFAFRPDMGGMGIVQVKIVSEEVLRDEWTEEDGTITPPDWIAVQAIMEAKLTGADWASVFVMAVGRSIVGHMVDVPLHDRIWNLVLQETAKFWALVDSGAEPPPDWEKDADAVAQVYRRSKPQEADMSDDLDLDGIVEAFDECRARRKGEQKAEKVLRARVLHGMRENEVVLTRRFRVKATTIINEAGSAERRVSIKQRTF